MVSLHLCTKESDNLTSARRRVTCMWSVLDDGVEKRLDLPCLAPGRSSLLTVLEQRFASSHLRCRLGPYLGIELVARDANPVHRANLPLLVLRFNATASTKVAELRSGPEANTSGDCMQQIAPPTIRSLPVM